MKVEIASSYGSETSHLIIKREYVLRAFDNIVLRMSGSMREQLPGGCEYCMMMIFVISDQNLRVSGLCPSPEILND
jgi:hypothetical protein